MFYDFAPSPKSVRFIVLSDTYTQAAPAGVYNIYYIDIHTKYIYIYYLYVYYMIILIFYIATTPVCCAARALILLLYSIMCIGTIYMCNRDDRCASIHRYRYRPETGENGVSLSHLVAQIDVLYTSYYNCYYCSEYDNTEKKKKNKKIANKKTGRALVDLQVDRNCRRWILRGGYVSIYN